MKNFLKHRNMLLALLVASSLLLANSAHASLQGTQVTLNNQLIFPPDPDFLISNVTRTIGTGTEYVFGQGDDWDFGLWDIDIDPDTNTIKFRGFASNGADFVEGGTDIYTFSGLNWGSTPGVITGASITANNNLDQFLTNPDQLDSPILVGFTDDSVTVTFTKFLDYRVNPELDIQLSVSHVPVPPALWLFGSGLLAIFRFSKNRA